MCFCFHFMAFMVIFNNNLERKYRFKKHNYKNHINIHGKVCTDFFNLISKYTGSHFLGILGNLISRALENPKLEKVALLYQEKKWLNPFHFGFTILEAKVQMELMVNQSAESLQQTMGTWLVQISHSIVFSSVSLPLVSSSVTAKNFVSLFSYFLSIEKGVRRIKKSKTNKLLLCKHTELCKSLKPLMMPKSTQSS